MSSCCDGLARQISQLTQLIKQQNTKIAQLEKELKDLKSTGGNRELLSFAREVDVQLSAVNRAIAALQQAANANADAIIQAHLGWQAQEKINQSTIQRFNQVTELARIQ